MGGKGGGDYTPDIQMPDGTVASDDPNYMWDSSIPVSGGKFGNWVTKEEYAAKHPAPAAAAAPEPEVAAPEPAAMAVATPEPTGTPAPATDTTLAPPASVGGAPAPGAGDALGGAVLKPPKYWTGGLDQYESVNRTGRGGAGAGSMRTTQT